MNSCGKLQRRSVEEETEEEIGGRKGGRDGEGEERRRKE